MCYKINDVIKPVIEYTPEHRYMSWEHCYTYFQSKVLTNNNYDEDHAALMLGFYLASWGMYRGSSALLTNYTYVIHKEAINIVRNNQYDIQQCFNALKKYYESKQVSGTQTLITKIMLGTLGCVPAYDTLLKKGIGIFNKQFNLKLSETFNQQSYRKIVNTLNAPEIIQQIGDINAINIYTKTPLKVKMPIAKIIDMYFWSLGQSE